MYDKKIIKRSDEQNSKIKIIETKINILYPDARLPVMLNIPEEKESLL